MKKLTLALALVATMGLPAIVQTREVTFTTEIKNYSGEGAYVALYLVDAKGVYQRTLWVAGEKPKYYKHLSGWARGSGLRKSEYDGLTGASVLSKGSLVVTAEIADELFDAGYEVRIDTAVERSEERRVGSEWG